MKRDKPKIIKRRGKWLVDIAVDHVVSFDMWDEAMKYVCQLYRDCELP